MFRADSGEGSTATTLNLLDHMAEKGVRKSLDTFLILAQHWFDRKMYSPLIATLEDMEKAGHSPPVSMVIDAFEQVVEVGPAISAANPHPSLNLIPNFVPAPICSQTALCRQGRYGA